MFWVLNINNKTIMIIIRSLSLSISLADLQKETVKSSVCLSFKALEEEGLEET